MWVYVCIGAFTLMCTCMGRPQENFSCCFLGVVHLVLRHVDLPGWAWWVSQWVRGICFSSPPWHWDYKCWPLYSRGFWFFSIKFQWVLLRELEWGNYKTETRILLKGNSLVLPWVPSSTIKTPSDMQASSVGHWLWNIPKGRHICLNSWDPANGAVWEESVTIKR